MTYYAKDHGLIAHQQWLGYVQPDGLVVSIPALLAANARLNQNIAPEHNRLLSALPSQDGEPVPESSNFPEFARAVLDWPLEDLYGSPVAPAVPTSLEVTLPVYGETLRPTYALRSYQPPDGPMKDPPPEWISLVQVLPNNVDLDAVTQTDSRQWQAGPQARFERLLRQTRVFIGLLTNGRQIRLVYAPEKELSGHITFNLADMVKVAGRPIFAAMHMLLSSERLYSVAENERLPAILANSRKYQNVVSTQLAGQVVEALYELLRGFQAADDQAHGALLKDVLARDPNHVYRGLLTTLLRLVFLLYAEDRALLSTDSVYSNHYSITGLYERLRSDDGRYHDTMHQRYGAWAQLLVLFRLVFSGARHGGMRIQERKGYLFDPDRYLFLEGRYDRKDRPAIPRISDGVIFNVLSNLLVLDGERLSYRTLAVEQIGSVYQAIMGFSLEVAGGPSIAIKPAKKHGAPATINLEELLRVVPDKRLKWLADSTDQKLTGQAADALKAAKSSEELLAALERKIAKTVTPNVVPNGAMIFQPSDERRKSGSHYTPSSLTGPIVEAALEPVLKQLGENPTPAQILNLKVCDPAMGSAAFLVEACRQLGDALVKAWHAHNEVPSIPPDEDETLYAQRIVAQRCLYGLDKNEMATDLAKLSLWLATLAKDHPFTFLDHSLRHGDSLVGLTRRQIAAFNWAPAAQQTFFEQKLRSLIERVTEYRQRILSAREETPYAQLEQELAAAEDTLSLPRMIGDAIIAAFFSGEKPKLREETRKRFQALTEADLKKLGMISLDGEVERAIKGLRRGRKGIDPFHWELEFPEVFAMDRDEKVISGFDVIIGNPPFAGKNTLINAHADAYLPWLQTIHAESHGNSDLVAHFFRRAFTLLRAYGRFGLIATNTIGQGDTRSTGLRWICTRGGTIYWARKRLRWPGEAAVVVSVVHVCKGELEGPFLLDSRKVPIITAYLFHAGGHEDPARLKANEDQSFQGSIVLGMGFTFDDTDRKGVASPIAEMDRLIAKDPRNRKRILPYIGGEEVNDSPTHAYHRYVINFEDFPLRRDDLGAPWKDAPEEQCAAWLRSGIVPLDYPDPVAADWPDLINIVERKVKPERELQGNDPDALRRKRLWWLWGRYTPALFGAQARLKCMLAINCGATPHMSFCFLSSDLVFANTLAIVSFDSFAAFSTLQSRVHEVWARFMASSMKDDLRYTPSDCFETFPLPARFDTDLRLSDVGCTYYKVRSQLMQREAKGLTTIYNWFHNQNCDHADVLKLRQLHDDMDRVVLDAYGWTDIQPQCEFIPEFDDEQEEDDNGRPKKRKYRYRWPDDIRDEVLARLLELNRQRALEEGQLLPVEAKDIKPPAKEKRGSKESAKAESGLFAIGKGEA